MKDKWLHCVRVAQTTSFWIIATKATPTLFYIPDYIMLAEDSEQ